MLSAGVAAGDELESAPVAGKLVAAEPWQELVALPLSEVAVAVVVMADVLSPFTLYVTLPLRNFRSPMLLPMVSKELLSDDFDFAFRGFSLGGAQA